jgi:hypothetical protein
MLRKVPSLPTSRSVPQGRDHDEQFHHLEKTQRTGRHEGSKGKGRGPTPKGKGRGGRSKGKGSRSAPGKGRGWTTQTEETPSPKTKSSTRPGNQKGKTSQKPSTPFQGECSYCGIYGHQSRDCRKRIYAESKKTQRKTNNSVTATQVTFDADEDALTGSEPDDETATMFQSALTIDDESDSDSIILEPAPQPGPDQSDTLEDETDDEEEREYYTAVIDGVRYLNYSVVVPPDGPPAPLSLAQPGNSGNANEPHSNPTQSDSRWGENERATVMETPANPDATQSSSVDPYPWGEGKFEPPTWGTWWTRSAPDPYDASWGKTTQRWGRTEREKVITRGGSPPPKLEQENNLFHDDRNQRVPHSNRTASDDLAFTTGKRTDGIVTHNARHPIPIHPNPFDALSNTNLPYPDFIPGTDPEDDERQDVPFSPAPPKTPKRTHEQRTRRRSRKTVDSDKNEYISDEERDLSMYRLSDEDSDSSLTIYYKAYSNNKPEINESNSESVERTKRMEEEIARMKEARQRKQAEKKRQRQAKRQRPRGDNVNIDKNGYNNDSDDDAATTLSLPQPAAYNTLPRTYAEFQIKTSDYIGHPHWDLCSPQE